MIQTSKYFLIFCLMISFGARGQNRTDSLNVYLAQGNEAYQAGRYPEFVDHLQQALKLLPGNGTIRYNMACGYALMGEDRQAAVILTSLARQGWGIATRALQDEHFETLRQGEEWPLLKTKLEQLSSPLGTSTLYATVKEKDLVPEGIAVDPRDGSVYLSSIYKSKVVKIDPRGQVSDFVQERAFEMGPTIGMKVDPLRNVLWVAAGVHDFHERLDSSMIGTSGLFGYDLSDGSLRARYMMPPNGHFLNDLDIAADGTIYLSDSKHPAVYKVKPGDYRVEKLLDVESNYYPNGIALSPDNRLLYLAGPTINVIDLQTLKVHQLKAPENIVLSGDGLYYYKGSLIAVQNGGMNRISRFFLDDTGYEVTSMEVLEANHPEWIIPTTGSVHGSRLFYIGNSQLRAISPEGKIAPPDQLKPVQVRVIELEP